MRGAAKVFFDTWGWLAIAHRDDRRHADVGSFYRNFLMAGGIPVTTDYVLAETISLLRSRTTTHTKLVKKAQGINNAHLLNEGISRSTGDFCKWLNLYVHRSITI